MSKKTPTKADLERQVKQLQKDLVDEQLRVRQLFDKASSMERERDRARAALVEASINASRLVEAVEPRNMALACS